jgi:hypothetical protein
MSEVAIRAKIKEKLEARKGTGQPLKDVFDEHKTNFPGYPCATFEPVRTSNDFQTTGENERHYFFEIVLHQEMEKVGRSAAIGILSTLYDTLVQDFESDYNLGETVDFCKAIESDQGQYHEGAGWVLYKVITLECIKSFQIM